MEYSSGCLLSHEEFPLGSMCHLLRQGNDTLPTWSTMALDVVRIGFKNKNSGITLGSEHVGRRMKDEGPCKYSKLAWRH